VATLKDVLVPDIGDFTGVPVIELLVSPGDTVAVDDPLVVLESDKATMEIPAPFAGTLESLTVSVGDEVSEGTKVAVMELTDAEVEAAPEGEQSTSPPGESGAPASVASAVQAEAQADETDGPRPGPEPSTSSTGSTDGSADESGSGSGAGSGTEAGYGASGDSASPSANGSGAEVHASPVVRRLARERGIDLATLSGTGRGGRITKEDLEKGATAPAAESAAPSAPDAAALPPAGEGERVPLTRIQQISAKNLSGAWQTIPHVTHHDDADITELEAFRKQLNSEQSDVKVTMVALLLKAAASALDTFPRFASSLDGDELVMKAERHIAFAADTPKGLMVPVVRDVDQKGLLALAGELTELSGKARDGKLGPKEMGGAVFTISSLGGIGGTGFTPIVNPPQVAILGVVRSAMQPVWDGAAFQPRLILPLSLSYDHRVIDGALAARFTAHLAKLLTDFRRVLL
jgi:pyruvate dehydrogenase E2 component (dihydrolipoamide acetyltransferase)